jgi:uncharacterized protein DUF695
VSWFKPRRPAEAEDAADPWTLARTEEDGLPVILRFRSCIPPGIDTARYPHLVNICWQYDGESTEGMPPPGTHERLLELEQLLDALEGPDLGFLVLAVTGNGRREWIWYVADVQGYLGRLNQALQGQDEPFPIELETNRDPTWSAYTQLLPPKH